MLDSRLRDEMVFYATTGDYSDAPRYEKFALDCKLDEKGAEIGRMVHFLLRLMSHLPEPIQILETASATGLTAAGVKAQLTYARIDNVYTSLDIEPNLLEYARARDRGARFVQSDFERLPFANDMFDVYIMMAAEGYRPRGTFYSEVHRVLRPRGFYVMPQIGPHPYVGIEEKYAVLRAGLCIAQAEDYLIAQKSENFTLG